MIKTLDVGVTFTLLAAQTLIGVLLSGTGAGDAALSLNGVAILFTKGASDGAGQGGMAYIPLKLSLKTGDKLTTSIEAAATLFFS